MWADEYGASVRNHILSLKHRLLHNYKYRSKVTAFSSSWLYSKVRCFRLMVVHADYKKRIFFSQYYQALRKKLNTQSYSWAGIDLSLNHKSMPFTSVKLSTKAAGLKRYDHVSAVCIKSFALTMQIKLFRISSKHFYQKLSVKVKT